MDARYVFAVRFRLDPEYGVRVDPEVFETRMERAAADPGEPGWLFFRDNLWRGEVGDRDHFRGLAADALGVDVDSVAYRALETDREYYDALKAEIGANLDLFKADSTPEVLNKYLGSSVEVED
ncbi:LWR-salt protein [Halobacterium sp. CBA1126]|uniref:LWR-salt protein n=1 Tax=Halobacterium sp. CBA1126 TaxID=2668074 RepID=UPI0012F81C1C|nr:LWR-salt protein [Halobacterium sp. CBA1126]MUV61860.1 LWR-salt protein [Halobacterium sp. CBA1126]